MGSINVGTSGWSYAEWKDSIYDGVPQRRWLERYAELFGVVEVNLTYRRDLTEQMAARWIGGTPPGFRFIIKAHQRATHFNRLKSPDADVPAQVAQATLLGERLGLVYFQLPHNFLRDDALLATFLRAWPSGVPAAWEFLHPSWHDPAVHDLLRAHSAAWVISDARADAPEFVATSSTGYVRLRADTYPDRILEERAAAIRSLRSDHTWVFVRHGPDAPQLAQRLDAALE